MRITLESIDGQQFTLRLPRSSDGHEHVVALHTTRGLRGVYAHDAHAIHLDPVEADEIVGEVAWLLAHGALHLAGPMRLGATSLDLDIARDDRAPAITGDARCASMSVPDARVTLDGVKVRGALEVTALHARHDPATDVWTVVASTFGAQGLSLSMGGVTVQAVTASLVGLRLTRSAEGLVVMADEVTFAGLEVVDSRRTVRVVDARVTGLRYAPDGLSFDRFDAGELSVALDGLDEPASEGTTPDEEAAERPSSRLGIDLPLLDGLHGRIEADTSVDVKLPVIHHRVARHRARLAVSDGCINFKDLEHGLSRLEDAIFDFEVKDDALVFELDALLVKKTLLSWPLDGAGVERAHRDLVRLRTLVQPTLARATGGDDEGDGDGEKRVALQRVEVRGLLVDVGLSDASTLPVGGGVVRLGAADAVPLESLRVRGELVHDARQECAPTEVHVEVRGLDLGVDGVAVGGGRLSLARLSLGHLTDGAVTMRGFRPTAARATARDVSLRKGRWLRA